ncbi:nuclear pore complex protein Nup54-like [Galendromus occidentalis]|uniref:Nuclear pore complex protein Nup54-like n=1 Tax=Galendromus occidentalis TaxID=34638 RepID=A0AAJ7P9G3_9ACAR|nr:nuclear pore complex protein Nup54-like [Galendromus occidentalis]
MIPWVIFHRIDNFNALLPSEYRAQERKASNAVIRSAPENGTECRTSENAVIRAVTSPQIYNDERDRVVALFNRIQASFGFGQGFFSQAGDPVEISAGNPFCVFKSVTYKRLRVHSPSDGFVYLIVAKSVDTLRNEFPRLIEDLNRTLVNSPTERIICESMEDLGENRTAVAISVIRSGFDGVARMPPSNELRNALVQSDVGRKLENLGVVAVQSAEEFRENSMQRIRDRIEHLSSDALCRLEEKVYSVQKAEAMLTNERKDMLKRQTERMGETAEELKNNLEAMKKIERQVASRRLGIPDTDHIAIFRNHEGMESRGWDRCRSRT